MKYIFDKEGLEVLEAFCFTKTLFAFDYDGTLAPIVDDPDQAFMRPRTQDLLGRLVQRAPIAAISGRKRDDLLRFIPPQIDYVIGNHGLEGIASGVSTLEYAAQICSRWKESLKQLQDEKGLVVEDKTYSLSIHYRNANDRTAVKTRILEVASNLLPSPRIIMGKYVVNLVAAGAPHKGVALLELMLKSSCKAAVYVGDDDNDEDVFRLGEENLLTVRVGKSADSAAQYYINCQEEIDRLLELCAGFLADCRIVLRDRSDPQPATS